jgi:predicted negative regulator of RcsB-dependent stress response
VGSTFIVDPLECLGQPLSLAIKGLRARDEDFRVGIYRNMVIIRKKHVETAEEKENRLRKEAEEKAGIQDEYQAKGFELVSWMQDHKGIVIGVIVLFLIAGAIFSGYSFYQQRANEEATAQFLAAVKNIESMEKEGEEKVAAMKKAEAELQTVASNFSRTRVAVLANIYAGHLALETNEPQAALKSYQNAINAMDQHDQLRALAVIGLGYAQERNGDANAALKSFESVINSKENAGKDLSLFEAARIATDLKEYDKAKEYRERLLKEFPNSVYEKNAMRLAIQ